jgi:hypothetical protein
LRPLSVTGRLGSPREAFSFGLSLLPDKESPRAEGIEKEKKKNSKNCYIKNRCIFSEVNVDIELYDKAHNKVCDFSCMESGG